MFKQGNHTPAHLFLDNMPYFITGAIYLRRPLLKGAKLKDRFIETLRESFTRYGWTLNDWVVLDDHYHLLAHSGVGTQMTRLMRYVHGTSSNYIHQATGCELPVWWNF